MAKKSSKTERRTKPSARLRRRRLARECAKLNPVEQQAMAEEGIADELAQWPEYGADEPEKP